MKTYKVWAVIEEYDDEKDVYKDVSGSTELLSGSFDTLKEAEEALHDLK